jgi:hypothetical protein
MERLELPETGQAFVGGHAVVASNIWERDGALRAQIVIDEERPFDVAEGDEVAIGGARWRVEMIVEDPAQRRGSVVLAPAGPMTG